MLKNKKIPLYGSGKQIRDFTYIEDVIDLVNAIIKKYKNKKNSFALFNSGKGQCITIQNLIKLLSQKLKIKAKIEKKTRQIGDVSFTNSSSKKINKILKVKPKISLSLGIDHFLEWYHSQGKYIK